MPCFDVIMIAFFKFSIRNMVFHCIFLTKKAIIITSKHGTRIFFPMTILYFSKKTLRTNVPKSTRIYKQNVLMPPGHPIILLKLN